MQTNCCVRKVLLHMSSDVLTKHTLPSLLTSRSTMCDCKEGFGGPRCDKAINECSRSPCPVYKLCRSTLSGGYECVCPRNRAGPTCTEIINPGPSGTSGSGREGDGEDGHRRPTCLPGQISPNCVSAVPQQRPVSFSGMYV